MQIPIKAAIDRIPGGTMVVPLFIGAIAHTMWPSAGSFFGSFTGGLLSGAVPLSAAFFVCLGTTLEFRSTGQILVKGGALLAAKVLSALAIGVVAARFLGEGEISSGAFAGLSVLALVASMNDTNGTMFVTLMHQFGRPKDAAAYGVMSIESGPFFTMLTLGAAGLAAFPWQAMLGAVLPLVIGAVLGNIDRAVRDWLSPVCGGLIPLIAFALGSTIDLGAVWKAGVLGLGLGVFVFLWTGLFLYAVDRLTHGTGVAGVAAATTAPSSCPRSSQRSTPRTRRPPPRPRFWSPPPSSSPRSWHHWAPPSSPNARRSASMSETSRSGPSRATSASRQLPKKAEISGGIVKVSWL